MSERLANGGKPTKQHCRYCCNDGFVLVSYSKEGHEAVGPCPFCDIGLEREFGQQGRDASAARPVTPHKTWLGDGFWKGRPTSGIELSCHCFDPAVFDHSDRMRELGRRFVAKGIET